MNFYQIVKTKKNQHDADNFNSSRDMKVRLEMICGTNLPKCDIGILAKSDPYCIISLWNKTAGERTEDRGVELARTKKILKTLNPKWNETLEFTIKKYKSSYIIYIDVVDWDRFGTHDDMGSVVLDLSEIETNQVVEKTALLGPPFQQSKVLKEGATITFKATVLSFGADDRKFLQMAPVRRLISKGRAIKSRNRSKGTTLASNGSGLGEYHTRPIRKKHPKYEHYVNGTEQFFYPFEPWEGQQKIVSVGIFSGFHQRAKRKLNLIRNEVMGVEEEEEKAPEKKKEEPTELTEAEQKRLKELMTSIQSQNKRPSRFSTLLKQAVKEKREAEEKEQEEQVKEEIKQE
mmetsp:Transcript_4921/g.7289  ORF Transcript_4921/g.7289 Transcript_4921/m.7289 type:complete len:346 (+) Transcript_4921:53-1090(+)